MCLATTLWSEEGTDEHAEEIQRCEHFKNEMWKELINNGARTFEIKDKSQKYPVQVLDHILSISKADKKVCLQLEIARDEKNLHETSAGQVLDGEILERVRRLEGEKKRIDEELRAPKEELAEIEFELRLLRDQMVQLYGTGYPAEVEQTDPLSRLRLYPKQWNRNW